MEKFIGTKIVQAEPMTRGEHWGSDAVDAIMNNACAEMEKAVRDTFDDAGYRVVYEDGYRSWSPKEVFEQTYRQVDGLSFGLALEAAKKGKKIARKGWNGKGQYVELGHDFQYDTYDSGGRVAFHDDIGGKALVFVGTRGSQVGWLASQADMLADDWYIVE